MPKWLISSQAQPMGRFRDYRKGRKPPSRVGLAIRPEAVSVISHKKGGDKLKWYNVIDDYYINKDGMIKHNDKIWPGTSTRQGYYELCTTNRTYRRLVHVILAELFLTKPSGDYVVDHIDNDKSNNKLENLRYISRAANASKGNVMRDASTTRKRVAQYTLEGELIMVHNSIKEACIAIGVNSRSPLISYACKGRCSTNNCNTAYGYKWSSVDDDIVRLP